MQGIIDTFASEYHWSKEQTFEIYPEEVPLLYKRIAKRNVAKTVKEEKEKLIELMSLINITHAEKPSEVFNTLKSAYDKLDDMNNSNNNKPYYSVQDLDKKGLDRLKQIQKDIMRN